MPTRLKIQDFEITIDDDKVEDFTAWMSNAGIDVRDDQQNWTQVGDLVNYNFDTFLERAVVYSNMSPPDFAQFSEKVWGAASLCIVEHYLVNHRLLVHSHSAKGALVDCICCGLNGEDSCNVTKAWTGAENCHSNFYNMNYIPPANREALVEMVKLMKEVIKRTDHKVVEMELLSMKKLNISKLVTPFFFKIGTTNYMYDRIID